MLSVPGSDRCIRHGGKQALQKIEETEKRLFRLAHWQTRVNDFADHDKVKGLREEIGILRMILESTLLRCKDSNDLLMFSSKIADLVTRIEKVVVSCHRLEASTGALLDKTAVLQIAAIMVTIISTHISDVEIIDAISQEIVTAVGTLTPELKAPIL